MVLNPKDGAVTIKMFKRSLSFEFFSDILRKYKVINIWTARAHMRLKPIATKKMLKATTS